MKREIKVDTWSELTCCLPFTTEQRGRWRCWHDALRTSIDSYRLPRFLPRQIYHSLICNNTASLWKLTATHCTNQRDSKIMREKKINTDNNIFWLGQSLCCACLWYRVCFMLCAVLRNFVLKDSDQKHITSESCLFLASSRVESLLLLLFRNSWRGLIFFGFLKWLHFVGAACFRDFKTRFNHFWTNACRS